MTTFENEVRNLIAGGIPIDPNTAKHRLQAALGFLDEALTLIGAPVVVHDPPFIGSAPNPPPIETPTPRARKPRAPKDA